MSVPTASGAKPLINYHQKKKSPYFYIFWLSIRLAQDHLNETDAFGFKASCKGSKTAVEWVVTIECSVEVGSSLGDLGNRFLLGVRSRRLVLLLLSRLLELLLIVILVMLFPDSQVLLDLHNQLSNFLLGNFVLSQDVRVLLVQLLGCLIWVGMEDQLLEQDGVDLLLLVRGTGLVVYANDWGFVSYAES